MDTKGKSPRGPGAGAPSTARPRSSDGSSSCSSRSRRRRARHEATGTRRPRGPARSGRADAVLRSEFKRNYAEEVSSRPATVRARRTYAAASMTSFIASAAHSAMPPTSARRCAGQLGTALRPRTLRDRDLRGQGHRRRQPVRRRRQGRSAAGRDCRGRPRQSVAADRAVRRRQRPEGRQRSRSATTSEGHSSSLPITLVILRVRVRRAGRGRHPAAAGAHRRPGARWACSPIPSQIVTGRRPSPR